MGGSAGTFDGFKEVMESMLVGSLVEKHTSGIGRSWIFVVYTWNMTTCATSHTYFDIYLVYDTPCNINPFQKLIENVALSAK
jgi:hypothetical protein